MRAVDFSSFCVVSRKVAKCLTYYEGQNRFKSFLALTEVARKKAAKLVEENAALKNPTLRGS